MIKHSLTSFFLFFSFLFFSALARADYVEDLQISSIQGAPNGGFILGFTTPVHSSCTTSGTDVVYAYPNQASQTQDGIKTLLTIAMTAFATQKNVNVHVDTSSAECWVQYLMIEQ